MHIHPEGVEVLQWFGFAALIVFLFILRFSNIMPDIYGALLEWASTRFPSQKRRRGRNFKLSYRTKLRRKIAFWILCAAVSAFLVAEWFVIPEAYRLSRVLLLPLACAAFAAGSVVIGIGPMLDEHGSKWRRWPFWVTVVATSGEVYLIARLLNPQTPRAVCSVLMLSLIPFVLILSFMDYVDGVLIEAKELGFKKDYDGTMPPVMQSEHRTRRR